MCSLITVGTLLCYLLVTDVSASTQFCKVLLGVICKVRYLHGNLPALYTQPVALMAAGHCWAWVL